GDSSYINQMLLNPGQQDESVIYRITSTANGCNEILDDTLTIHPLQKANVGTNNSLCEKHVITLGAPEVVGNTYEWSQYANVFSTVSSPEVSPPTTTDYKLKETILATGCIDTNNIQVIVHLLPVLSFDYDTVVCKLE